MAGERCWVRPDPRPSECVRGLWLPGARLARRLEPTVDLSLPGPTNLPLSHIAHILASCRGLSLLGWLALVAAVLWLRILPNLDASTTSFPGYWLAGRLVLEGTPVVQLYDDAWLAARLAEHGFSGDRLLGPPAVTLTLVPLAWLPYTTARAIWMLAVLGPALLGSLWWLGRRLGPTTGLLFAGAVALGRPAEAGLEVAQTYPLMLALHCLALWAWRSDRPLVGALGLAPMMLTRGWHGLPQALGWLCSGRWRGTAWALGLTVVLIVATVPVLGLAAWEHFFLVHAREAVDSQTAYVLAYQSWRSLALHLTTFDPVLSPDPPLLGLGRALWLGGVAVVGAASLFAAPRLARRAPLDDQARSGLGFALWTCVALLLAPFAEDHQMLLAALPAAVLWAELPVARPLVLAALALLLPAWDFDRPQLLGGWRSLLAYPRVYAVGLLWLGCLLGARRA